MAVDFKAELESARAQIDWIVSNHRNENLRELAGWLRKELEEMFGHAETAVAALSELIDERDEDIEKHEERIAELEKELEEALAGDDG